MPTIQAHFDDETYRHLIDNFEKGDRSEAVREAYQDAYMGEGADA